MNLAGQCVVGYCRKAGSNHTKTILSLVRGWVVVGVVLGSGVAWAVGESKIVAPNGCVFNIQQLFGAGTVFKTVPMVMLLETGFLALPFQMTIHP